MLSLTLRQLEYATAVARHGGMTAAAQALHVSQPALSVALGQLETLLGRPLFLRRAGGRLTPTAFGRSWLELADAQLSALVRLTDPNAATEDIRLAVFADLAPTCLAPILTYTARLAPHLKITPQVMDFEMLSDALYKGKADLALTWDLGLQSDIARQTLARIAPHAVLAPDHPLAHHPSLRLADLGPEALILTDQGLSLGHMRGLFAQAGLTPQIRHRTASLDLMRSYAANGLGVGLSYTNPAARLSPDGKPIVTRPISDAGTEPLILAHLAQNPPSAAAQQLASLIPQALPTTLTCDATPVI
ncbi:LysR family transcriptional regulator [Cypionkella aquatica]|uniref:LysR family transcriptional regulator n=1 Tax=Cypionkella aquatica TaxID=1756042 RepID=A0AA37X128_9RHOB|nr:LysR family transcriptional regulator [Cypionkella aquatica]GLS85056.1 LysR family transcriptional regulator [Cypionkella aquatica]